MSDMETPTTPVEQNIEEKEITPKKRRGRSSFAQKANDESQALLKEMGFNDSDTPGRRRTRAATRGEVYTPPPKRQRRSAASTPPSSGRRSKRLVVETPNEVDDPMEPEPEDSLEVKETADESKNLQKVELTPTKKTDYVAVTPEQNITEEPTVIPEHKEKPTNSSANDFQQKIPAEQPDKAETEDHTDKPVEIVSHTDTPVIPKKVVEPKKPAEVSASKATEAKDGTTREKPVASITATSPQKDVEMKETETTVDVKSPTNLHKEADDKLAPVQPTAVPTTNDIVSDNGLEESVKPTTEPSIKQSEEKLLDDKPLGVAKPVPITVAPLKNSGSSIFSNSTNSTFDSSNPVEGKVASDSNSHTPAVVE